MLCGVAFLNMKDSSGDYKSDYFSLRQNKKTPSDAGISSVLRLKVLCFIATIPIRDQEDTNLPYSDQKMIIRTLSLRIGEAFGFFISYSLLEWENGGRRVLFE